MAALQLVTSQNTVKAASPEAPAYGQQPAAAGQPGAAAGPAAAGTATGQLTGSGAVALLNKAGLGAKVLTLAGEAIQKQTGNKQLSTSGDSVIDTMLQGMGYTVS
jgi:uroporphyrinogen-III synthase